VLCTQAVIYKELSKMFTLPFGVRGHGDGIDGMLTMEEGEFLETMAKDRIVLELGSWCGLSAIVMSRTAQHVYTCDWHHGDREMGYQDTLIELETNLKRFDPLRRKITVIAGMFGNVLPMLKDLYFDMVYIDGAHDHGNVRHDTQHAMRLAFVYIVWHDGNREVVSDIAYGTGLKINKGPGRMIWAQKGMV
jgi:hypothetical protein